MLRRRLVRRALVVRQIEVTTAIDAFVAILAFSLLLCIEHSAPATGPRPPTPTEWAVISVAIGCVGGSLFHLFVGSEREIKAQHLMRQEPKDYVVKDDDILMIRFSV